MKLCGYGEECFTNGDKYWGHLGGVLCLYLIDTPAKVICRLDKCRIRLYTNEAQYKDIIGKEVR